MGAGCFQAEGSPAVSTSVDQGGDAGGWKLREPRLTDRIGFWPAFACPFQLSVLRYPSFFHNINSIMYVIGILLWVAMSGLVGYVATERNRSAVGWAGISVLFSPLIGFLALIAAGDASSRSSVDQTSGTTSSGSSYSSGGAGRRKCLRNNGKTFPADRERCPHCNRPIKVGGQHPRAEE